MRFAFCLTFLRQRVEIYTSNQHGGTKMKNLTVWFFTVQVGRSYFDGFARFIVGGQSYELFWLSWKSSCVVEIQWDDAVLSSADKTLVESAVVDAVDTWRATGVL